MIGRIVGGVVAIAVGFTLLPSISNVTTTASAQTIIQIVPAVFGFAIAMMAIGIAYSGLRDAGLIGSKYQEDYETDMEEKLAENPNHKQTYYEYVQERIAAQKAIRGRWW
jgi:hypothetical protein